MPEKASVIKTRQGRKKQHATISTSTPQKENLLEKEINKMKKKGGKEKEKTWKGKGQGKKTKVQKKGPEKAKRQVLQEQNETSVSDVGTDDLCQDDEDDDAEDAGNRCLVCDEFGRNNEMWYRCTSCGLWAHAECTGWESAEGYVCDTSREMALYVLDCIFSVTVVGSLVVFVWRGSWALLDIFLYPDDQVRSFWTSLVGGYVVVLVTFALQIPMRWAAARLHGAPRLLLVDVYHLMSFVATVLKRILFNRPKFSNWSIHIISLTLLILLNCSNSILVRGVYIDAEEPAGDCVVFPCHYLRLFFHKERTKKRHSRVLAAAALAAARKTEEASMLQTPEEKV
ncbi:hypothetical protein RR48_11398 [Papilio machaon]|uniref:Uncharacterized protein n=1 Tax=Papilio machaon TaxID=76193 RepID=A0A194QNG5_PAPMA|nr:hypothetical protein RR48_11398 [Papilio machaon]